MVSPYMISPRFSFYINLVMAVLGVVMGSTTYFTDMFGSVAASHIAETAAFTLAIVGAANVVLHGYSSPQPGSLVSMPPPPPELPASAPPVTPPGIRQSR